jgi:hypothetical protein
LMLAALLVTASAGCAQSLGDVARQTRQKEKAKGAAKKKVLTNEDLPADIDPSPGDLETIGKPKPVPSTNSSAPPSADEWKAQILEQKNAVASLKAQIDKLNDSVRFVEANAYYNGVAYNEHQKKKQMEVERMRTHLAEQQKQLEAMQEAAKQAGMGSAVYDP